MNECQQSAHCALGIVWYAKKNCNLYDARWKDVAKMHRKVTSLSKYFYSSIVFRHSYCVKWQTFHWVNKCIGILTSKQQTRTKTMRNTKYVWPFTDSSTWASIAVGSNAISFRIMIVVLVLIQFLFSFSLRCALLFSRYVCRSMADNKLHKSYGSYELSVITWE